MKTTVEISDPLFRDAKRVAQQRGTTLRQLIEEGLRQVLEAESRRAPRRFLLEDASVPGRGLQRGIRDGDWGQLSALIYDGRGG